MSPQGHAIATLTDAPLPIWIEDISEIVAMERDLAPDHPVDGALIRRIAQLARPRWANRAAQTLAGERPVALAALLGPKAQAAAFAAAFAAYRRGAPSAVGTHTITDAQGRPRQLRLHLSLLREGPGHERCLIFAEDLTSLDRAESELTLARRALTTAEHLRRRGRWSVTLQDDALTLCDETQSLFGRARDAGPRTLSEVVQRWLHPDDRAQAQALIGRARQQGGTYTLHARPHRARGCARHLRIRGELSEDGAALRGVVEDATAEWIVGSSAEDRTPEQVLTVGLRRLRDALGVDRVWLVRLDQAAGGFVLDREDCAPQYPGAIALGRPLPDRPALLDLIGSVLDSGRRFATQALPPAVAEELADHEVISLAATPITPRFGAPWLLVLHQCSHRRTWDDSDLTLLDDVGRRLEDVLSSAPLWRALARDKARLEVALDSTGAGLWDYHIDRDRYEMNARAAAILDRELRELSRFSQGWSAFIHPDDTARLEARFRAHLAGHADAFDARYRVATEGGAWRWIHTRGRVVAYDPVGRPSRVVGTHLDITKRARAQIMARLGSWERDLERDAVDWSCQTYWNHGVEPGSLIPTPRTYLDFVHPDDLDAVRTAREAALVSGAPLAQDYRVVWPDGSIHHLRAEAHMIRGGQGEPLRQIGYVQDVTADREAAFERCDHLRYLEAVSRISDVASQPGPPGQTKRALLEVLRDLLGAAAAVVFRSRDPEAPTVEIELLDGPTPALNGERHLDALARRALAEALDARGPLHGTRADADYLPLLDELGADAVLLAALRPAFGERQLLALHRAGVPWSAAERDLFGDLCDRLEDLFASLHLRTELEESKARLELAIRGTSAGLWEYDVESDTSVFSAELAQLLGFDEPGCVRSSSWMPLLHPDDRRDGRAALVAHLKGATPNVEAEVRVRHHDERWRWLMVRGRLADGPGPRRVIGIALDITDQKQAELALAAERDRAETTFRSIADAVIATDARGRVERLNPAAEALTGWTNEEARGQPLGQVFQLVRRRATDPGGDLAARSLESHRLIGDNAEDLMLRNRDGRTYAVRHSAAPIRDRNGYATGVVLTFTDETERRELARQLTHQAAHDALTGLVNRREFEDRVRVAIRSARDEGRSHALCYLDLDQFKLVNDTVGHTAGDELLKQMSELLHSCVRGRDTLARLGGDEFSVLLEDCCLERAEAIAKRMVEAARTTRFEWQGHRFDLGVSVGVVAIDADAGELSDILSRADVACYTAKDLGRGRAHVYRIEDAESARRHSELYAAAEISAAVEQDRFVLHAQAIVPLGDTGLSTDTRYELLVRMLDEDGGFISPGRFIPAAERYDLMGAIDRWVLRAALTNRDRWFGGASVSINLSGHSIADATMLGFLHGLLDDTGVDPTSICFELTETAAVSQLSRARHFIDSLRARGCSFALDDFGAGLSSLTYLKELPVDILKIDGRFVRGIAEDETDYTMVSAINSLAHTLGLVTVAEFVENQAIAQRLREIGVDYAQGYAFGRPVPTEAARRR